MRALLTKKNIISFLVIAILLLAIPFTMKLIQQRQNLQSKASTADPINFTGPNVSQDANGGLVTTDATVQVELRSPLGPPAAQ